MDSSLRERVKKILKEHTYTLLVKTKECEIWNCKKEGTVSYSFIISILPNATTVTGDIGHLLFSGKREIDFLAGEDIEYYIHSKLIEDIKREEFDTTHFQTTMTETIKELFHERKEVYSLFPESKLEKIVDNIKDMNLEELEDYFSDMYFATNSFDEEHSIISDLKDCLEECIDISNENDAYQIYQKYDFFGDYYDLDINFNTICSNLLYRLYMVNEASQNILKIKNKDKLNG